MDQDQAQWVVDGCSLEEQERARDLFEKWLKHCDTTAPQDVGGSRNEKAYFAAMLYLVLRSRFHARTQRNDTATPKAENVTIRNIMAGVGTTVCQFFKAMTKVLELAAREKWLTDLVPNGPVFVNEFKQVEVKFMFVYMLHEKLKKTYREMCLQSPHEADVLCIDNAELHAKIQRLIWTLFLAVRQTEKSTDLVPGFFLLLASIHAVLSGRPRAFVEALVLPEHRDPTQRQKEGGLIGEGTGAGRAPDCVEGAGRAETRVLAKLCEAYCPTEVVKAEAALAKVHKLLDQLIAKGQMQGDHKEEGEGVDGRGIGRDDRLDASIVELTAVVEAAFALHSLAGDCDCIEVDGLMLLDRPELVGSPHDKPPMMEAAKRKHSPQAEPCSPPRPTKIARSPQRTSALSPMRDGGLGGSAPPMTPERGLSLHQGRCVSLRQGQVTPMQGVMGDVRWLSIYVRDEATRPDDVLRNYFKACDTDVTDSIIARLEELPEQVVKQLDDEHVATAIKLYLKSLRHILRKEEERLRRNNFTNILQDDSMHRAFLATCFEMVMHTHLRHQMPFPQIPTAFRVCALEFYIMTDNFLRYFEGILPTEMRRHLVLNRERILDLNIWMKDSTLVGHLRELDLCSYFSRALETCHRGASNGGPGLPPQASPMIVRSVRESVVRKQEGAMAGIGALLAAAGMSGGAGGLAASLFAMHRGADDSSKGVTSGDKLEDKPGDKKEECADGRDVTVEDKTSTTGAKADVSAVGGGGSNCGEDKTVTPEKSLRLSAAGTPDKNGKLHIQKQLACVARGLWHRVSMVLTELCHSLQVSDKSLARSLSVANRILCNSRARELVYDRHLHQVLMCVLFAVCRVEEGDQVLFKKIINQHHNLFSHLQLGEQIYWILEIGPAANQTGNLIEFYNKKFIPLCKEFVLEESTISSTIIQAAHATGNTHSALGLPPRSPMRPATTHRPPPSPSRPPPSPVRPVQTSSSGLNKMMAPPSPMRQTPMSPHTMRCASSPPVSPMNPRDHAQLRQPYSSKLIVSPMKPRRESMTPRTERLYTYEKTSVSTSLTRVAGESASDSNIQLPAKRWASDVDDPEDIDATALLKTFKRGSCTFSRPPPPPTSSPSVARLSTKPDAKEGAKKDLKGILEAGAAAAPKE